VASEHLRNDAQRPGARDRLQQHQRTLDPTVREVLHRLVATLAPTPEFMGVFISDDPGELSVYTVIDTDENNMAARYAVYDAELAATTGLPDVSLDFRLMNIRDYPGKSLSDILPSGLTAVLPATAGH
jgi:hypothetical protein